MFAAAPTIPFSSPHRSVAEQVVTGPPDGVANEFQLTIGSEAMEKCGGRDIILPHCIEIWGRPHSLFHRWLV